MFVTFRRRFSGQPNQTETEIEIEWESSAPLIEIYDLRAWACCPRNGNVVIGNSGRHFAFWPSGASLLWQTEVLVLFMSCGWSWKGDNFWAQVGILNYAFATRQGENSRLGLSFNRLLERPGRKANKGRCENPIKCDICPEKMHGVILIYGLSRVWAHGPINNWWNFHSISEANLWSQLIRRRW